jgi:DNA-binding protein
MQLFKTIDRACQIHALIQKEATGTPDEFAKRLHISRRLLYYLLDELKDVGAEIEYNRRKSTFYYANDFEIHVTIRILNSGNFKQ